MKGKLIVSALTAVLFAVPPGSELQAQQMGGASRFDLGVYAGGSWTSDWFESRTVSVAGGALVEGGAEESYGIGTNPIFGANMTFWASPTFGVRLNGSYMPTDIPRADGDERPDFFSGSPRTVNNYLYDLNLVLRPWFGQVGGSSMMSSAYVFLGGGGYTADPETDGPGCVAELRSEGACLPLGADHGTVGQGVLGIGFDLLSLAGLGVFAELAGHGYSAPVRVGDDFLGPLVLAPGASGRIADKRFAVTTRLVGGLKLALGSMGATPMAMAPPPPPPPAPPAPAPPPAPATRQITVCVVQDGQLQNQTAMFDPASNDTTVAGQSFAARYPATAPTYAAGAPWFVQADSLNFEDRAYVKFGVSRVVQPPQLRNAGDYQGTAVFVESGTAMPYQVLYIPIRPGCEFQPYQLRESVRPRGSARGPWKRWPPVLAAA